MVQQKIKQAPEIIVDYIKLTTSFPKSINNFEDLVSVFSHTIPGIFEEVVLAYHNNAYHITLRVKRENDSFYLLGSKDVVQYSESDFTTSENVIQKRFDGEDLVRIVDRFVEWMDELTDYKIT